jgi:hypothetical protein
MKNLIKNILKEDFNPEDFDWIKEINPMEMVTLALDLKNNGCIT